MNIAPLLLFAPLASASFNAAGPARFDLSCTGVTRTVDALERSVKRQTIAQSYRIDLESGFYCSDGCRAVRPIAAVAGSKILFEPPVSEPKYGQSFTRRWFNRRSGYYFNLVSGDLLSSSTEARCIEADFSGFPSSTGRGRGRRVMR